MKRGIRGGHSPSALTVVGEENKEQKETQHSMSDGTGTEGTFAFETAF
jgi:hypothetical protein